MDKSVFRALAAIFAAALSLPLFGATYYVGVNGSDDNDGSAGSPFATVAKGVNVASDGDEVVILAGSYARVNDSIGEGESSSSHTSVAVELSKAITVRGETGDPEDVVLGRWSSSVGSFNLSNAGAVLRDVKLINMSASEYGTSVVPSFTAGRIENCIFYRCYGNNYGGAINEMKGAANDTCIISNCVFKECFGQNGVEYSGGAIRMTSYGTIIDSQFIDNNCRGGGGAIASSSANPQIIGCTFSGNWSGHGKTNTRATPGDNGWGGVGGAINCTQSAGMLVSNCVFASNRVVLPVGKGSSSGANTLRAGGAVRNCNLYNCVITNNYAVLDGGAIYGGKAVNCLVADNEAGNNGGGTYSTTLVNCTITANTAAGLGGGAYGGTAVNSIVYGNTASSGNNYNGTAFTYSCTTPDDGGTGNITDAPKFKDSDNADWTLRASSPCVNVGDSTSAQGDCDLAGESRIRGTAVDMGCYEADPDAAVELSLSWSITGDAAGYDTLATSFSASVDGNTTGEAPVYYWDIDGDGTWDYTGTQYSTLSHTYSAPGIYTVICKVVAGSESDTLSIASAITVGTSGPVYVNASATASASPYLTAETGAPSISAALSVLKPGGTIYVEPGTYSLGMTIEIADGTKLVGDGSSAAEVIITTSLSNIRPFILNDGTIANIRVQNTSAPATSDAADYPYTASAILSFGGTITNCYFYNCRTATENSNIKLSDGKVVSNGGAVAIYGETAILDSTFENCFSQAGDGALHGGAGINVSDGHATITRCTFKSNTARGSGGGVYVNDMRDATAEIWNCTFTDNKASDWWGFGGAVAGNGSENTVCYNCLFVGNYLTNNGVGGGERCSGGGAYNAALLNCTVVNNQIRQTAGSAGHFGAGIYKCAVTNSIVWANSNTVDSVELNWSSTDAVSTFGYSCTTPEASGTRNYSSDPCFLDTWHLSTSEPTSLIFGKGLKFGWMASAFDLDGNPRLRNGKVTPGCYEDFWFSLPLVIRMR